MYTELAEKLAGFVYIYGMKKCLFLLFIVLIIVGCKKKTIDFGENISFNIEKDISYGNDSEQKLDLYIPQNKDSIKGIFVMIHGGGWKAGDKSNLTLFTLSMMEKFPHYGFANMNYRLASNSRFGIPNQTVDIDKVIGYLKSLFKNNPQFILLGNSAGAHLSMLYAYKFNHDKKIKVVVNIVGPADLSDEGFKSYSDYAFVEKRLVDASQIPDNTTADQFASPVYWITNNSASTVSFYGSNDKVIPLSQKKILDSVLNKKKVYNQSFEFSGGHLDWGNKKNAPTIINEISDFLKHIK